jgi:hypothetical protein
MKGHAVIMYIASTMKYCSAAAKQIMTSVNTKNNSTLNASAGKFESTGSGDPKHILETPIDMTNGG